MPSHRGHQKKLEKKKKQRLAVQRDARASHGGSPTPRALEREAVAAPFGPAFMSAGWKDGDEANPTLISVLLSRALGDGTFVASMLLVDRTCLGIKNAYTTPPLSRVQLED